MMKINAFFLFFMFCPKFLHVLFCHNYKLCIPLKLYYPMTFSIKKYISHCINMNLELQLLLAIYNALLNLISAVSHFLNQYTYYAVSD